MVNRFRLRGTEVSRMEGFADCVFGFGLTLLVVSSLETPRSFPALMADMRGFVAFGICFAVFFGVWSRHYHYCRRFGLEDPFVQAITAMMLFLLLGYLYPLKFLAMLVVKMVLHIDSVPMDVDNISFGQIRQLFIIYGAGFAGIQLAFTLLYAHAYRLRESLGLNDIEQLDTKWWMAEQAMYLSVALLSIILALLLPDGLIGFAGWAYFLMGFGGWIHGSMHGKRRRMIATE